MQKILVVDDVEVNRELLRQILEDEYIVEIAEDGEQAICYLAESHEDTAAILLDLQMPKMDGMAVIEQRNHFAVGDKIEFFSPKYGWFQQVITEMYDQNGEAITVAPHAQQLVQMSVQQEVYAMDLLRKPLEENA